MTDIAAYIMKTRYILGLTAVAAAIAATSPQVRGQNANANRSGGMLSTMPQGNYQCVLPGDAGGAASKSIPDGEFRLGAASSYVGPNGRGVYLLKGNTLTFTRGPRKGERYRRVGTNQLRQLDANGSPTNVLCTRLGAQRFS